jgi:uncharacterized membrane protein
VTTITKSIDVRVPLATAYNQWTQFEEFPHFMDGVERVEQLDDRQTHWVTRIAGVRREFDAEIVVQKPEQGVSWHALTGTRQAGRVTFAAVSPDTTTVHLTLQWDPQGLVESAGDALGLVERRVEGDLRRFKEFIETRGTETGAWRGEIHDASAPAEGPEPLLDLDSDGPARS